MIAPVVVAFTTSLALNSNLEAVEVALVAFRSETRSDVPNVTFATSSLY